MSKNQLKLAVLISILFVSTTSVVSSVSAQQDNLKTPLSQAMIYHLFSTPTGKHASCKSASDAGRQDFIPANLGYKNLKEVYESSWCYSSPSCTAPSKLNSVHFQGIHTIDPLANKTAALTEMKQYLNHTKTMKINSYSVSQNFYKISSISGVVSVKYFLKQSVAGSNVEIFKKNFKIAYFEDFNEFDSIVSKSITNKKTYKDFLEKVFGSGKVDEFKNDEYNIRTIKVSIDLVLFPEGEGKTTLLENYFSFFKSCNLRRKSCF